MKKKAMSLYDLSIYCEYDLPEFLTVVLPRRGIYFIFIEHSTNSSFLDNSSNSFNPSCNASNIEFNGDAVDLVSISIFLIL